jgi:uroporphyrinogen III methyltransferase/synthase
VALVANATLPTQRVVRAPLSQIVETCGREHIEPPALIIVGQAAAGETSLNWFMRQPLFGKTIVATRDPKGNAELAQKIISRGGQPVEFATVAIKPQTESDEFLKALAQIAEHDWIIFTSPNGVAVFFDALYKLGKDARVFAGAKLATLGVKTAMSLERYGIRADFVPTVFTGQELGHQLMTHTNVRDKRMLLLRSELASNELPELLLKAGAQVRDVPIYTAVEHEGDGRELLEQIQGGAIDWLTFASPSSVRAFFARIPPDVVNASKAKVASIGPVTGAELARLGVRVDLEASEHTVDGMLAAIESAETKKGGVYPTSHRSD